MICSISELQYKEVIDIADGTRSKEKCPSCGQETLIYQNGCLSCASCGYSKCG